MTFECNPVTDEYGNSDCFSMIVFPKTSEPHPEYLDWMADYGYYVADCITNVVEDETGWCTFDYYGVTYWTPLNAQQIADRAVDNDQGGNSPIVYATPPDYWFPAKQLHWYE